MPPSERKRPRRGSPASAGSAPSFGAYAEALAGDAGLPLAPLAPQRASAIDSQRLQAKPHRTERLPEGLEGKLLPAFVQRAAASLPHHAWAAIGRHVAKQPSGPVTFKVGTACSGSEFYLTALPLLEKEISQRLGRDVRFDHRWSCEIEPRKRQWIMDNFAPKKLFSDITRLAEGRCHDFVSGGSAEVDEVDILIAGTSCKDASRLNPHHMRRLNVVESGAHSTGGTFQGFARLVAKLGPRCRVVYLENVASLRDKDPKAGRSNFDGVRDAIRALGFGFIAAEFSARDMGLPVARPRLYMAGIRCGDEGAAQRTADEVLAAIAGKVRSVPLDSVLLPPGEPHIQMRDWMPEGLARQREQPCNILEVNWQGQHRSSWAQIPPRLAEKWAPRFAANPWFSTLPERQRDLLLLTACRHDLARKAALAIPLHTSLGWESLGSLEHLPTLVPRGVFWLVGRRRPLLGIEAVRLQGCDPSSLPGLGPESHDSAFLTDLAGNAFCVYQFCAWLFAVLAAGDLAEDASVSRASAARALASGAASAA